MENNTSCSNLFRVLSIQSHVVYGYVGNKIACFSLQLLGFDVDSINSVHFSNHTGYKKVKGPVLKPEELQDLYDGLKANDLLNYGHILTGYSRNGTFLTKVLEIIQELKRKNPNLFLVCDPVMGDNGKMYVSADVLPIYRDSLVPMSDLITPNQFEAELLTGKSIQSEDDVFEVINHLHNVGVKTVVLSSVRLQDMDDLMVYGSTILNGTKTMVSMQIPKLSGDFTGTGDLFSALLLAWLAKTSGDLKVSLEKTVNSIHCVLLKTLEHSSKESSFSLKTTELKLIQSKLEIENPVIKFQCQVL